MTFFAETTLDALAATGIGVCGTSSASGMMVTFRRYRLEEGQ